MTTEARKDAAAAGIVVKTPVWVGFDGKNAVEIKVRPMFGKEGAGHGVVTDSPAAAQILKGQLLIFFLS